MAFYSRRGARPHFFPEVFVPPSHEAADEVLGHPRFPPVTGRLGLDDTIFPGGPRRKLFSEPTSRIRSSKRRPFGADVLARAPDHLWWRSHGSVAPGFGIAARASETVHLRERGLSYMEPCSPPYRSRTLEDSRQSIVDLNATREFSIELIVNPLPLQLFDLFETHSASLPRGLGRIIQNHPIFPQ